MDGTNDKVRYPGAYEITGLSLNTIYSMVSRHQIPHYRLGPRLVVFSRKELLDWMASRRVEAK